MLCKYSDMTIVCGRYNGMGIKKNGYCVWVEFFWIGIERGRLRVGLAWSGCCWMGIVCGVYIGLTVVSHG